MAPSLNILTGDDGPRGLRFRTHAAPRACLGHVARRSRRSSDIHCRALRHRRRIVDGSPRLARFSGLGSIRLVLQEPALRTRRQIRGRFNGLFPQGFSHGRTRRKISAAEARAPAPPILPYLLSRTQARCPQLEGGSTGRWWHGVEYSRYLDSQHITLQPQEDRHFRLSP